jgi:deoxyribodipyrimidine photo-lyase
MSPRRDRAPRAAVVLFTRDLRVHDHPSLSEAARTSEQVAPLFVLDDRILRRLDAPNRVSFLLDSLADLRRSLRERGSDLIVRRGDPVEETLRVARAVDAGTVLVGCDASLHARTREAHLARACRRERLELRIVNTTSVVPPGALAPADRDHYRVFTPYWRRWQAMQLRPPARAPARLRLPAELEPGELPSLRALTSRSRSPHLPPGGERAGRRRLEQWLAHGLAGYERDRDLLAASATSRLSPYLRFGCVSALEAATRTRERPDGEAFLRQLCWRDFYHQLLAANPQTPQDDLRPRGDRWPRDDEALARWSDGRTGYPIVDAAMRQLTLEGWLPNRARLIVASFLAKTLYLDWRLGAGVFSRLLVDADVASNVGNWQWMAGTGIDTRPNRVLNPVAQAKRFDPDGAYVRRYVPELAELAGSAVHEPWKASRSALAPEYPGPIVDHIQASERFRAARRGLAGLDGSRA